MTKKLKWKHDGKHVDGFKLYIGSDSGYYTDSIDLGRPPKKDGYYEVDALFINTESRFLAVSAYNQYGMESGLSNVIVCQPKIQEIQPPVLEVS